MGNMYKTNRLYKTISLLCALRNVTIAGMCKKAGISPGLITDLKMGRKQTIQIETATKIADALDVPVNFLNDCDYELTHSGWDVDTCLKWHDADSDSDRLFLLHEYGVDTAYLRDAEKLLLGTEGKMPTPEGERLDDPDIYRIQRARKEMTPAERKKMMNVLEASFEEYFSDKFIDDDVDE